MLRTGLQFAKNRPDGRIIDQRRQEEDSDNLTLGPLVENPQSSSSWHILTSRWAVSSRNRWNPSVAKTLIFLMCKPGVIYLIIF